jgi:uncharacterized protein
LADLESLKGAQVAVLLVPSAEGEPIEGFSLRVAESWKLGRKGVDDGALLVVAKNDRQLRWEVGYGLEGALPDAVCQRIIDEVMVPRFREGNFPQGISNGVDRVVRIIKGEPLPPRNQGVGLLPLAFGAIAIILFPFLFLGGLLVILSRPGGWSGQGGWHSNSKTWGGGGGFGGGGGGFRGGGGGFGGGGASGRW